MERFVAKFEDGRYEKDCGSSGIQSKKNFDHFNNIIPSYNKSVEKNMTTDINEARVYNSIQAIRSSNVYSWGITPTSIRITIEEI